MLRKLKSDPEFELCSPKPSPESAKIITNATPATPGIASDLRQFSRLFQLIFQPHVISQKKFSLKNPNSRFSEITFKSGTIRTDGSLTDQLLPTVLSISKRTDIEKSLGILVSDLFLYGARQINCPEPVGT